MRKSGKARIPTTSEINHLFKVIQEHRYPEKNTAIMQLSFKLGLSAQEIALLQINEICMLGPIKINTPRTFTLHKTLILKPHTTKERHKENRSKSKYVRKYVTFQNNEFNRIVGYFKQNGHFTNSK